MCYNEVLSTSIDLLILVFNSNDGLFVIVLLDKVPQKMKF